MYRKINLQHFASVDEIVTQHADALKDFDVKGTFDSLSSKLSTLGYDVIFNNKEKAEFIPSGRLSEVVVQREAYKKQFEETDRKLKELIAASSGNDELSAKLKLLQDENTNLLKQMEEDRINSEIMVKAAGAKNPLDVLAFINVEKIKVNSKGEISGVEEEITRIKTEKPYLFGAGSKGGIDEEGGQTQTQASMNSMIRKLAGR